MKNSISWIKVDEENDTNSVVLSTDKNLFIKYSRFSLTHEIVRTSYYDSNCYTIKVSQYWHKSTYNIFSKTFCCTMIDIFLWQIINFQASDAGVYRCRVFDNSNDTITAETRILVRSPPKIFSVTKSLIVMQGEPFKLECYASGAPTPSVTWRKKSGVILITGETVHK